MHTTLFSPVIIKGLLAGSIKLALINIVVLGLVSCRQPKEPQTINDLKVLKKSLTLHPAEGKWYYKNEPFNGYALEYHANGKLAERVGYYQGKKEGLAEKWFENNTLLRAAYYRANRLDGLVRTWWPDGSLCSESNYIAGVSHGVQKKWYPNGQLARQTHIYDGKEEGIQQAWRRNGKLYANYEARNGRVFGLKRSNLCYALEDEIVQYD